MSTIHCEQTISIHELTRPVCRHWQRIDVRSATEFAAGHIPGAVNLPMDEIENRLADLQPDQPTILICQAGKRASLTHALLAGRVPQLSVLEGGTDAWEAAGLPLVRSVRSRWALERQVRLLAGLLVVTGVFLGFLVYPAWYGLAAFVGCGLIVAGTTNYCAMAHVLARLPWNKPEGNLACPPCADNRRV